MAVLLEAGCMQGGRPEGTRVARAERSRARDVCTTRPDRRSSPRIYAGTQYLSPPGMPLHLGCDLRPRRMVPKSCKLFGPSSCGQSKGIEREGGSHPEDGGAATHRCLSPVGVRRHRRGAAPVGQAAGPIAHPKGRSRNRGPSPSGRNWVIAARSARACLPSLPIPSDRLRRSREAVIVKETNVKGPRRHATLTPSNITEQRCSPSTVKERPRGSWSDIITRKRKEPLWGKRLSSCVGR